MEGLSGKAEELGLGYDKRPYVGAWLRKLDLDTQSDVSRRTAVIISISKDSLHFLEDENEGLNPGATVQTGGASVGGCFVHTEAPYKGHGRNAGLQAQSTQVSISCLARITVR